MCAIMCADVWADDVLGAEAEARSVCVTCPDKGERLLPDVDA